MPSILSRNTGPGGVVIRERPLCPYPQTAIYTGGDPNLAASFRCGGRNKLDDPGSRKFKGRDGDHDDGDDDDD